MNAMNTGKRMARRLALVCAFGFALAAGPVADAKAQSGQGNPHASVWDQWQPMSGGFIARRRVPARIDLPAEQRRSPVTQERAEPGRDLKPWERLSLWFYTGVPGLYGVRLEELSRETGIGIGELRGAARSGRLSVLNEGTGRPWYFDASWDVLLFAGEEYRTFHAEGNAYQLRQTQTPDPARMSERQGSRTPAAGEQPKPFRETLHFEEETDMLFLLWLDPTNPDSRYWYWDFLYGANRPELAIPLQVPNPATYGPGELRVRLHGMTDLYPGNDHRVWAALNGRMVGGVLEWDGLNPAELVAPFDQGLLNADGSNLLTLHSLFDAQRPHPGQLLESVQVEYLRLPVAEDGQLWLRSVSKGAQKVTGFESSDILVIESPTRNAVLRRDIRVYPDGSGWAVAFEAGAGLDYLVAEAAALAVPVVDSREQANLSAPSIGADALIIAPREFSTTARALADYRQARHGHVAVVWLDDIYKEFSFGRVDPFAVGRFMGHVRTRWSLAPSVVTLVGKGSLDRKDRMGYGDNFLPVLMTASPWQLAPSDARLLGVEDGITPFAVGRLPVASDAEGTAYVAKLMAHDWQLGGSIRGQAVIAADNADAGGDFPADAGRVASQALALGLAPVTTLVHPAQAVRAQLTSSQTWKQGLVTYSGHGTSQRLGTLKENFLNAGDAGVLSNATFPVFAALTCSAGLDAFPGTRSLAAALVLNPAGGAIAALAPTGYSVNADAHALGSVFLDHLFGRQSSVGGALAGAVLQTRGQIHEFMAPMYSVIGDPGVHAR